MNIVRAWPPNKDQILSAWPFLAARRGIMFCWGDTIFAPFGAEITPMLHAHESVHSQRQGAAPENWWDKYLKSPTFRLEEEIPAHRAEFAACANRAEKLFYLKQTATRLAGPLYGNLISLGEAKTLIAAR